MTNTHQKDHLRQNIVEAKDRAFFVTFFATIVWIGLSIAAIYSFQPEYRLGKPVSFWAMLVIIFLFWLLQLISRSFTEHAKKLERELKSS